MYALVLNSPRFFLIAAIIKISTYSSGYSFKHQQEYGLFEFFMPPGSGKYSFPLPPWNSEGFHFLSEKSVFKKFACSGLCLQACQCEQLSSSLFCKFAQSLMSLLDKLSKIIVPQNQVKWPHRSRCDNGSLLVYRQKYLKSCWMDFVKGQTSGHLHKLTFYANLSKLSRSGWHKL